MHKPSGMAMPAASSSNSIIIICMSSLWEVAAIYARGYGVGYTVWEGDIWYQNTIFMDRSMNGGEGWCRRSYLGKRERGARKKGQSEVDFLLCWPNHGECRSSILIGEGERQCQSNCMGVLLLSFGGGVWCDEPTDNNLMQSLVKPDAYALWTGSFCVYSMESTYAWVTT